MKFVAGTFLAMCLTSLSVSAYDFTNANAAFAARENSIENLQNAERLYQAALGSVQGAELVYAVEQLGRVYFYWGDLLTPENDDTTRKNIFGRCRQVVERIRGNTGPYYYWKGVCLALWGKSGSFADKLEIKSELLETLSRGEAFGGYESGGIHRVAAGVFIRSANIPFFGIYDEEKAMSHVNRAIALDTQQIYYASYLLKAEILKAQGKIEEARDLLESKRDELEEKIEERTLPAGVLPESKVISRQMFALLSQLR